MVQHHIFPILVLISQNNEAVPSTKAHWIERYFNFTFGVSSYEGRPEGRGGTIPGGQSRRPIPPGSVGLSEDVVDLGCEAGLSGLEGGAFCSSCTDEWAPRTIAAWVCPCTPGGPGHKKGPSSEGAHLIGPHSGGKGASLSAMTPALGQGALQMHPHLSPVPWSPPKCRG